MDNEELHQKWPEIKTKLKEKHPELTDDELRLQIGKEGETLQHLQNKLGKNWNDIRNWLSIMG